jgi:hypothetical protein
MPVYVVQGSGELVSTRADIAEWRGLTRAGMPALPGPALCCRRCCIVSFPTLRSRAKQSPGGAIEFLQLHLLDGSEIIGAARDRNPGSSIGSF